MTIQLPLLKKPPSASAEDPAESASRAAPGAPREVGRPGLLGAGEASEGLASAGAEAAERAAGDRAGALRTLRVGDLAKRTGKTVRALHLYEELGLLVPAQRSSGGYRLYTRDAELRVRWIEKLQQMGFSLTDIKQIVQDVDRSRSAPDAMQRVQDLFREKLDETREQLGRLVALESELQASLAYLETCDSCETEELLGACASCARHDCTHKTPELVLGFRAH